MNSTGSSPDERIAVLHLISGLTVGGAETMLLWSARAHDRARYRIGIASLMSGGALAEPIGAEGVPVFELGAERGRISLEVIRGLLSAVRRFSPDILQSHLFHANILSRVLRPVLGGARVVNTLHTGWEPWGRRFLYAATSPLADAVLSFSPRDPNAAPIAGTGRPKRFSLPYGIPFPRPATPDRAGIRAGLGIGEGVTVWGAAGRLSPEKGFDVLIEAFSLVGSAGDGPTLLLLGEGGEMANLKRQVQNLGLAGRVLLLGNRIGLTDLFGAVDYFVLPSRWESGPLVLLEAMAAGLPVVATDVGQVSRMVQAAGAGTVVSPGRPREMALAMESVMAAGAAAMQEARAGIPRLKEQYDFYRVQAALEDCYRIIAGRQDR